MSAPEPDPRLIHHDLCFGCGPINPFGLQMELAREPDGAVTGRFFVKQDHQGERGIDAVHDGVIAAALSEVMAVAVRGEPGVGGASAPLRLRRLELVVHGAPGVGAFVRVRGQVEGRAGEEAHVVATASRDDGPAGPLAEARATFALA